MTELSPVKTGTGPLGGGSPSRRCRRVGFYFFHSCEAGSRFRMMTYQFWVTAGLFTAAVLFLVVDAPAATRSNRNMQKAMQQFRQQQVKQYQAQQAAAAASAKAQAEEAARRAEIHRKASQARTEKIEAERTAARERRLAEQKAKGSPEATSAKKDDGKTGSAK